MSKDKILKIRIREQLRDRFKKVATKKGVTMSELITDFIKQTSK